MVWLEVVDRDRSAGIATRYGLDGPGIESWLGEIFCICPDRLWGPPSLLYNRYRIFPGGKAAGAWRWQPTPSSAGVKERVELYIYASSGPSCPVLGWNLPSPLSFWLEVRHQITETYFLHSVKALLYLQFAVLSATYTPSFNFLCAKPWKWVDSPPDRLSFSSRIDVEKSHRIQFLILSHFGVGFPYDLTSDLDSPQLEVFALLRCYAMLSCG